MAVGDVQIAVRRDGDIGRFVEEILRRIRATNAGPAERQQHATVGRVLEDLAPFDVVDHTGIDNPQVALGVKLDPVREHELAGTEAAD